MKPLVTLLLLSAPLFGQHLPDAPSATATTPTATAVGSAMPAHRFLNRPAKFALAGSAALVTADAVLTCRHLAAGGREVFLPTQSCAGVTAWLAGSFAAETGIAYLLHRTGHHRLERLAEIAAGVSSASGIGYTAAHPVEAEAPPPLEIVAIPGGHIVGVCIVGQTC
jgi:hypothetical protein